VGPGHGDLHGARVSSAPSGQGGAQDEQSAPFGERVGAIFLRVDLEQGAKARLSQHGLVFRPLRQDPPCNPHEPGRQRIELLDAEIKAAAQGVSEKQVLLLVGPDAAHVQQVVGERVAI